LTVGIRQLGVEHVLFDSNLPVPSVGEYQQLLWASLGLRPNEVRVIPRNVAPYLGARPDTSWLAAAQRAQWRWARTLFVASVQCDQLDHGPSARNAPDTAPTTNSRRTLAHAEEPEVLEG
jgi:hypothetical protein